MYSEKRLSTKEAAAILQYSESTLRQWRKGKKVWEPGLGPRFYTINGRAFYTKEALDDWEFLCGSGQRHFMTERDNE